MIVTLSSPSPDGLRGSKALFSVRLGSSMGSGDPGTELVSCEDVDRPGLVGLGMRDTRGRETFKVGKAEFPISWRRLARMLASAKVEGVWRDLKNSVFGIDGNQSASLSHLDRFLDSF